MKSLFVIFAVLAGCVNLGAAESAQISLTCVSPQVEPASAKQPLTGNTVTLGVSSTGNPDELNGELEIPDEGVPYSRQSVFVLFDPSNFEPIIFPFVLDLPDDIDANTNGIADFFEVESPISTIKTQGRHSTLDGKGTDFTATWTRAAGQASGTVILDLPWLGMRFTHTFNLLDYEGLFTFTRTGKKLDGTVALTNVLSASNVLRGPFSITITNNNTLGYADGSWSGPGGVTYNFAELDALARADLNYISVFGFDDGLPATSINDYLFWFLVVHSSDANSNGVLDLVESLPQSTAPALDITKTAQGVQITIRGTQGISYVLEGVQALSNTPQWQTVQSITLSGATQDIPLAAASNAQFFRIRQL